MKKEYLKQQIETRFQSKRSFVIAYNEAAGFPALDETTLSRQLSGRVALSFAWQSAYTFFFKLALDGQ